MRRHASGLRRLELGEVTRSYERAQWRLGLELEGPCGSSMGHLNVSKACETEMHFGLHGRLAAWPACGALNWAGSCFSWALLGSTKKVRNAKLVLNWAK